MRDSVGENRTANSKGERLGDLPSSTIGRTGSADDVLSTARAKFAGPSNHHFLERDSQRLAICLYGCGVSLAV
jgi:hypothetical protein